MHFEASNQLSAISGQLLSDEVGIPFTLSHISLDLGDQPSDRRSKLMADCDG
jgi:hypothetical protein